MLEEGSEKPLQIFRFFATSATSRKLANYNLVFRPHPGGFRIFYSETPIIPVSERIRLTFGISVNSGELNNKFDLSNSDGEETAELEPGLCFDNLAADGSVITNTPASIAAESDGTNEFVTAADTRRLYGKTFRILHKPGQELPAGYILKHQYNPALELTVPVEPADTGTVITTINPINSDDYLKESGPYLLEKTDSEEIRRLYLHNELWQKSASGVIDLYWETSQNTVDAETGQIYHITFKPK